MTVPPGAIPAFLARAGADHLGRTLDEIWAFDDDAIEFTHDFIQWLFPLAKPSRAVPGAPVLAPGDIAAIRADPRAQASLARSAAWYHRFLDRNLHWLCPADHNHLRIARAIQSLRLLAGDAMADRFKADVIALADRAADDMAKPLALWRSL